ncbi:MAG: winged helix-turn-helix domain-containing protein, partial [Terriglobia bacterium]
MVTRDELQKLLWPNDTIVEFEHSINAAINRLREALCDSADEPRYVETLPRRGYRFIAPVESLTPSPSPVGRGETGTLKVQPSPGGERVSANRRTGEGAALRKQKWLALAAGLLVTTLAVLVALNVAGLRERIVGAGLSRQAGGDVKSPLPKIESIAVLPLENLSHDPEQDYFADGMT